MATPTVSDIMTTPVLTVDPETPVTEIAAAMREEGINSIVVTNPDCQPEGILTSTDFVDIVSGESPDETATVGEYMTTDVVTAAADLTVAGAAAEMFGHDVAHLPVVEDDDVIGIVTATDITEYVATTDIDG
jgi:signal-transduction protein with cAMP-binding, CBS, and nucleotidyltransferase domain